MWIFFFLVLQLRICVSPKKKVTVKKQKVQESTSSTKWISTQTFFWKHVTELWRKCLQPSKESEKRLKFLVEFLEMSKYLQKIWVHLLQVVFFCSKDCSKKGACLVWFFSFCNTLSVFHISFRFLLQNYFIMFYRFRVLEVPPPTTP